ncbi:hypothetical protein [Roseomonas rosulenta]|uniref:hypothetical protein n=1 Tax=Roseomonas rosulenta TaxID=2748667 RepID=UPI0034E25527
MADHRLLGEAVLPAAGMAEMALAAAATPPSPDQARFAGVSRGTRVLPYRRSRFRWAWECLL